MSATQNALAVYTAAAAVTPTAIATATATANNTNSGWYYDQSHRGNDILRDAYEIADRELKIVLTPEQYQSLLVGSGGSGGGSGSGSGSQPPSLTQHTATTFLSTLQQAQQRYEASSQANSKLRRHLDTFSQRVTHYGTVLDVLVQHHPEYVSLIWSTFKILFIAVSNHAETVTRLAKGMSRLFLQLQNASKTLLLYPSSYIIDSAAQVYVSVLRFLVESLKFYRSGKWRHAFDSVFKPWKLRFEELYAEVEGHSQELREKASLAFKSEQRDVHAAVDEIGITTKSLPTLIDLKFADLKGFLTSEISDVRLWMEQRFAEQTLHTTSVGDNVQQHLCSQDSVLSQIHLNQLLEYKPSLPLPSSGETLEFCISMRVRHGLWSTVIPAMQNKLQIWATQSKTSVLIVAGPVPSIRKDFVTDMTRFLRDQNLPVLWSLRFSMHRSLDLKLTDLMKMLVIQALQVAQSTSPVVAGVSTHTNVPGPTSPLHRFPITLNALRGAASVDDWVGLLAQALIATPRAFIILDSDLIAQATRQDRDEVVRFLQKLVQKLPEGVKIVLSTTSLGRSQLKWISAGNLNCQHVTISTDTPVRYSGGSVKAGAVSGPRMPHHFVPRLRGMGPRC